MISPEEICTTVGSEGCITLMIFLVCSLNSTHNGFETFASDNNLGIRVVSLVN